MQLSRLRARAILFTLVAVVLSGWWYAKRLLFEGFAYTSDLFVYIQMSRTWLQGKPFLYDNALGQVSRWHGYYILPAFGPLTLFFGAYGLFAPTILLTAAASLVALCHVTRPGHQPLFAGVLVLALILGPISFWIWDDPTYGWHGATLFLPFGILYAVALMTKSRWRWAVLALICLTREEGPILAFSIHFLVGALLGLSAVQKDNDPGRIWRRYLRLAPPYLIIFCGLLAVILLQAGPGASKLSAALAAVYKVPFAWRPIFDWMRLLSPFFLLTLVAHRRNGRAAWRALGSLGLSLLPLLLATSLASYAYEGGPGSVHGMVHGILWPPRFVLPWVVGIAGVLTCLPTLETNLRLPSRVVLVAVIVVGQWWTLGVTPLGVDRQYSVRDRIWPSPSSQSLAGWLTAGDKQLLYCLSDHIPPRSPVAVSSNLVTAFHHHDIVWPDRPQNAWQRPVLIVCEYYASTAASRVCADLREHPFARGFLWTPRENILVGSGQAASNLISRCLSRPEWYARRLRLELVMRLGGGG